MRMIVVVLSNFTFLFHHQYEFYMEHPAPAQLRFPVLRGGTGSTPPRQNGWHRSSRRQVSQLPRQKPCTRSASTA